ncbi:PH domain-containing protein [Brackiella oedipodis]|uniref:PH domain-containing protein n=1 Tax=Brackiella oedipodis TaxID=124225 RepID=UPI00048E7937|nr:PH domain-containing protein [Brackiella oedipodis]
MTKLLFTHLRPHEELICRAKPTKLGHIVKSTIGLTMILCGIPSLTQQAVNHGWGLLLVVCGALIFLPSVVVTYTLRLALTNQRIVAQYGFLHFEMLDIEFKDIKNIVYLERKFGKYLDYGTVVIEIVGKDPSHVPLIAHPQEFVKIANEVVKDYFKGIPDEQKTEEQLKNFG